MHATYTFLVVIACAAVILLSTCTAGSVELLELHGPDGQTYWVNAAEISSLRMPNAADLQRHFPARTHCIVSTTNGKFIAATETCREIRDRLAGGRLR